MGLTTDVGHQCQLSRLELRALAVYNEGGIFIVKLRIPLPLSMPIYSTHLTILDESAALYPTAPALRVPQVDPQTKEIQEWHPISYRQFQHDVEHFAKYWAQKLSTNGVHPRSVVGLW